MEPILTSIVAALVAGAVAKAKDVASEAIADAYAGLKSLIVRKLGKSGAVQGVEDDPESETARASLAEAISKGGLASDTDLKGLAERLEAAIADAKAKAVSGAGDIDVEQVRGKVNATVDNLVAAGRIRVGPVIAQSGDARVSGLSAGVNPARKAPDSKNG